jgi:hypothetical protein
MFSRHLALRLSFTLDRVIFLDNFHMKQSKHFDLRWSICISDHNNLRSEGGMLLNSPEVGWVTVCNYPRTHLCGWRSH